MRVLTHAHAHTATEVGVWTRHVVCVDASPQRRFDCSLKEKRPPPLLLRAFRHRTTLHGACQAEQAAQTPKGRRVCVPHADLAKGAAELAGDTAS
eukprot:4506490-Pleurochrysis_carterae.AAC.2